MKKIMLGDTPVGLDYPPYFIADIAANHDGDIDRALRLIELAKESGANAAKFQNFKAAKIVSAKGFEDLGGQVSHQAAWSKSVFEVYDDASLSDDWSPILKQKCDEVEIEYCTSPYDFASVDWADQFVSYYKIGSGDISWLEMLEYIANKKKPICLATGAATQIEVDQAMQAIEPICEDIVLMQCNTNYTADPENFKYLNLNVLKTYAQKYPNVVLGLSDHTKGHAAVLGAIALGARVIEKHFTDDNNREGPDHKFATTPSEWRAMVDDSISLFNALGDGVKKVEGNEQETCIVQKRGLYVTADLKAGQIIAFDDLEPLRPRSDAGFEPWERDALVGKVVTRDVKTGEMLLKDDVK